MRNIFLTFIFFLPYLVKAATSVDTVQVSWAELEQKSLNGNLQIQNALNEASLAKAELLEARAMYLPNVNFSYTFAHTNNPLMVFGTKLIQQRVAAQDFDPGLLNDPKAISDFATKFEVQQPIFNLDALYKKKAGEVKAQALDIKAERTREYVQFALKKSYMMLQLSYKMLETLEGAKSTTLANKKLIEDYFKNGMVQKSDVLYANVRLNEIENQLHMAKSNISNASDNILFLLDEDSKGVVLYPTDVISYNEDFVYEDPILNKSRRDIEAFEKSIGAYDYLIKSSTSRYVPRLNAFGSFEFHDKHFAKFRSNNYLVGAQLSWNIFDGLRAKSEQTKYKVEKNKVLTEIDEYSKQSALELNQAYRSVLDANNQVNLTKLAWEQSKEAYRIRQDRFREGLEKSADLMTAETMMSQKELEYHQAVFEFNAALSYYQFLK